MDNAQNTYALKFGLVGKNIDYSFSRGYFANKFKQEKLLHTYENFDIQTIEAFEYIVETTENLKGLNVTIPYKEAVIPYLDKLDKRAKKIGAVNTILLTNKGKRIGFNTDYYGFKQSLQPHLKSHHKKALILGTGGASKAIAYALKKLGITYYFVSRSDGKKIAYTYNQLTSAIISEHQIIINCTPLGTFPEVNQCPEIPYDGISAKHILYDLIYNPAETKFLNIGKSQGAVILNGKEMLELQAEKAWEIWNNS